MRSILSFLRSGTWLVIFVVSTSAFGAAPGLMSYQGRLTDQLGNPLTGTYSIQFSIYPGAMGEGHLWRETQSVAVSDGLFSVPLGSLDPVEADLFSSSPRYLGIKVGSDAEMTPRQQIASAGYAFTADNLGGAAVYVDSNSQVGIGTKAPAILEGANRYLTISGGSVASLELQGFRQTNGQTVSRIDFIRGLFSIPPAPRNIARIDAQLDVDGGGKLVFCTHDSSALQSPMSIDSQGKVKVTAKGVAGGVSPAPTVLICGNSTDDPFFVKVPGSIAMAVKSTGRVGIGTGSPQATLDVRGVTRTQELQITGGADIAEPFEVRGVTEARPGMIVAIDAENPGSLKVSEKPYDRCVAGIVSGAGGIRTALTLQQDNCLAGAHNVALTGRVYGLCDASYGPIEPGDLLTTSDTRGYAMKVTDHQKAQGAILGKAMSRLKEGKGLVLVLVTLQ